MVGQARRDARVLVTPRAHGCTNGPHFPAVAGGILQPVLSYGSWRSGAEICHRASPISIWGSCSGATACRRRICSLDGDGCRRTALGLPDFSSNCARFAEVGQKSVGYCTVTVQFCLRFSVRSDKSFIINDLSVVEAAGVEPASEIVVSRETPCLVHSVNSLHPLRIDKKRMKLVR